MYKLFCGTTLDIENFCRIFGSFLLQNTEDETLQHIFTVILTGKRQSRIENNRSVTEYFYDDQVKLRVSRIQTIEIQHKFETLKGAFENKSGLQLIVKKGVSRSLNFYIGEEMNLTVSTELCQIKVNPDTKLKLERLFGDSLLTVTVHVIV